MRGVLKLDIKPISGSGIITLEGEPVGDEKPSWNMKGDTLEVRGCKLYIDDGVVPVQHGTNLPGNVIIGCTNKIYSIPLSQVAQAKVKEPNVETTKTIRWIPRITFEVPGQETESVLYVSENCDYRIMGEMLDISGKVIPSSDFLKNCIQPEQPEETAKQPEETATSNQHTKFKLEDFTRIIYYPGETKEPVRIFRNRR